MKWKRVRIIVVAGVFLALAVLACGPTPEGKVVSIAINSPGSGAKVTVGQEVSIDSSASADAGVGQVELSVNGVLVSRDVPPSGNPTTFRVVQLWTPTTKGLATISVVAYDTEGARSDQATITLQVVASVGGVPTVVLTDGPGTVMPPGSTETPLPPVTTESGCTLDSQYVADVTIPDGTVMSPGQAFVKTWRVRNSGTCDWDTGHTLVFVSGEQMGGPGSVPLPAVPAGEEADVSVNLVAPSAYGTHKGTWRMRAADGTVFGANLTVVIEVPPPVTDTPEPTITNTPELDAKEVTISADRWGSVSNQKAVNSDVCGVGDSVENHSTQCFVTFDVSTIPDSATIEDVSLHYSLVGEMGSPFSDLDNLRVYHDNYGDLDSFDYTTGADSGQAIQTIRSRTKFRRQPRTLNPRGDTALQGSLAGDLFQIRIQFDKETDGDGDSDFIITNVKLKVAYRP